MKINIVSKADLYGGGASKVAVNLTHALKAKEINVTHFIGWGGKGRLRESYSPQVVPIFGPLPLRIIIKCLFVAQWKMGIPEAIPFEWFWVRRSGLLDADLIHVHDITELFSPLTLLWLSHQKPVVWTLHDFSPFTAGCIYPFEGEPLGCKRWVTGGPGCDRGCPIRNDRRYPFAGLLNGVPLLWGEKRHLARHGRIRMTVPSRWLADEAERSLLYKGVRPDFISNGIDIWDIFSRKSKSLCKKTLGFDAETGIIALIAGNLTDRNKGFSWAVETLALLPEKIKRSFRLLCIGTSPHNPPSQLSGFQAIWTGFVQDQRLLSLMLNAAELLLYPSMADNQPLAVIEALACGTPVFAFDTGGISEII